MGARNQEQTRGRIGPQLRLGNLRVGELHFCPLCTALDQASSLSRKLAYVPGPTFGFVKLLASSGSHCTKWAYEQHRQAGFESRLLPDLPLPFIPTLIGLRAFDLVSSRVWWEAATNKWSTCPVDRLLICSGVIPTPTMSVLNMTLNTVSPVGWGCRIHRLLICREVIPTPTTRVLDMTLNTVSPVGCGCRIHRLLICRGVRHPQRISWNDTKQSDSEPSVVLELCGTQSTGSLPPLPGLLTLCGSTW